MRSGAGKMRCVEKERWWLMTGYPDRHDRNGFKKAERKQAPVKAKQGICVIVQRLAQVQQRKERVGTLVAAGVRRSALIIPLTVTQEALKPLASLQIIGGNGSSCRYALLAKKLGSAHLKSVSADIIFDSYRLASMFHWAAVADAVQKATGIPVHHDGGNINDDIEKPKLSPLKAQSAGNRGSMLAGTKKSPGNRTPEPVLILPWDLGHVQTLTVAFSRRQRCHFLKASKVALAFKGRLKRDRLHQQMGGPCAQVWDFDQLWYYRRTAC